MAKKIIIGADHAGFQMKEQVKECLAKLRVPFDDYGTYSDESTDYPLIAQKVARDVAKNKTRGILICGTGIGMCISANKVKGVRAALAYDAYTSKASREHNDANVLCLGGRTTELRAAQAIVKIWLATQASTESRHKRRVKEISTIEEFC